MNIDLASILPFLTIGLIVYYFLLELAKPKKGAQSWVTWIFVGVVLLLVGYYFWSSRQKTAGPGKFFFQTEPVDEEKGEEDLELEPEESQPEEYNQEIYSLLEKQFDLSPGKSIDHGSEMTYQDFKFWYLTPEFLHKFTEATREAFRIKRRRLIEFRQKCFTNLDALKRGDKPKTGIAALLRDVNNHNDTKTLEGAIQSIDLLLQEIKMREAALSIETTRENLISAVTNRQKGIESLTGREEIKDFLALQLYTFAQNPRIFFTKFQNIAIYGPAGIGKTRVAEVIGHVYASSGILVRNHVQSATKADLTTAYVNESGRMTRKLLLSNLESVVFIDEAYDMTPPANMFGGKGMDHGHEAIAAMVNLINDTRGLLIIIVAGYEEEMEERFMKANKGLPRRFPYKLILRPYDAKELTNILIKFLLEANPGLKFNEENGNYLYTVIEYINREHPELFEYQAGDMDNLSAFISRAIYGSPGKDWNYDYEEMIMSGVNAFLALKGVGLKEVN